MHFDQLKDKKWFRTLCRKKTGSVQERTCVGSSLLSQIQCTFAEMNHL
jgi:hypothetical protein